MENDIKVKLSEDFAVKIYILCKDLHRTYKEYIISNQILRSGTSIGANIAEALYAESEADFIHKISISLKEASETRFWLKILFKNNLLKEDKFKELNENCESLIKILTKIIRTTKNKKDNNPSK